MLSLRQAGAAACAGALVAALLQGCGGGGGGDATTTSAAPAHTTTTTTNTTTTTTPHTPIVPGNYACKSNLQFDMVQPEKKGLCLDDTTLQYCADEIPVTWPNTKQKISSIRIFSSWQGFWPTEGRDAAWAKLTAVVRNHSIKVLMGTQITCNETDDDRDWDNVLQLIKTMGADNIMGIAFGNELELLYTKDYVRSDPTCVPRLWKGGYVWRKTEARAKDLKALGGDFAKIPLTSVFGAYALSGEPFVNDPKTAMVADYLKNATLAFGRRWVWAVNIYPYFDPGNVLDKDNIHCKKALNRSLCWEMDAKTDPGECVIIGTMRRTREKIKVLTGNDDDTLWIGETGWSYPQSSTLNTPVAKCKEFSAKEPFTASYTSFLDYNMTILPGVRGPDHIFYFTMRDSLNFGYSEHFGLIGQCNSTQCKLQKEEQDDVMITV